MFKNFFYEKDNFLIQGIVNDEYDFITAVQSSVPSGLPFLIIQNKEDLLIDDIFFDCGNLDFNNPDGYGYGMNYFDLLQFKKENNISNELIDNEINKNKDRKIKFDINKAKPVWIKKLREDRKPLFELLDVKYIRALESGDPKNVEKIVKKKQFLRDITEDERIKNAKTREDLLQVYIPPNFIEE
jgi:hypothetical protein